MYHSKLSANRFKPALSRLVFLALLLPSVSALADSPNTLINEVMQDNLAKGQAAVSQSNDTFKAVEWKRTTHTKSATTRAPSRKVTTDDYERIMRPASQKRPKGTVWLGNKNRSNRPELPKTLWLGQKGRSD